MQDKIILKDPKSFVVDRAKWLRGKGATHSKLRNSRGNQCCLGFYCAATGFSITDINNAPSPEEVAIGTSNRIKWNTKLLIPRSDAKYRWKINSLICVEMMAVNDRKTINDDAREKKLKTLFKRIKVKVKFIGPKKKVSK